VRRFVPAGLLGRLVPPSNIIFLTDNLTYLFYTARMTSQKFPEQYPAVTDEWAEPVATDNKEMAAVRPVLKNTNLERRALKLSYSANKNGWSALNFHQAVDRKGGALVVCTTRDGLLCGGYNPKGWVGFGENRGSIAAFLFVQNPNGSFTKLRKVGGAGMVCFLRWRKKCCFVAKVSHSLARLFFSILTDAI
jgi:hypothetical protein